MPSRKRQNFFYKFLNDQKQYPVLVAIAAGLYPIFFYYSNNYPLINSWKHLGFFIVLFLFFPVVVHTMGHRFSKLPILKSIGKYVLTFLNIFSFLFFLQLCLYASIHFKISLGILVIALLIAYFLHAHLKKIVVFQLLLGVVGFISFLPVLLKQLNYSNVWQEQPDDIENVVFKKTPNVYFIQPDGYTNFSELKKGYYKIGNNDFEEFLHQRNFKSYDDFRSNYTSTLFSNSSIFTMKHHYYNNGFNLSETINARDVIVGDNAVLNIFKKNNYKTYLLVERPYLLANLPKMGFHYSNFDYGDISRLGTGIDQYQEVNEPLKDVIEEESVAPKFFFIELFSPGHIHTNTSNKGDEEAGIERDIWIGDLKTANEKLVEVITIIEDRDPNALILIMADHGGYVGLKYMLENRIKTQDRDKLHSYFSSQLSIKWPNNDAPEFDTSFKSAVNAFRILFSYLSEDESYLNNLQEDGSFVMIEKGAPKGVYRCIDDNGAVVFDKQNDRE